MRIEWQREIARQEPCVEDAAQKAITAVMTILLETVLSLPNAQYVEKQANLEIMTLFMKAVKRKASVRFAGKPLRH